MRASDAAYLGSLGAPIGSCPTSCIQSVLARFTVSSLRFRPFWCVSILTLASDGSRPVTSLTLTTQTSSFKGDRVDSVQALIRAFLYEDSHPYTPAFASSGSTPWRLSQSSPIQPYLTLSSRVRGITVSMNPIELTHWSEKRGRSSFPFLPLESPKCPKRRRRLSVSGPLIGIR